MSVELDGMEHREILGSSQLTNVLAQYLHETIVVFVFEGRDLTVKDWCSRSSDPYINVYVQYKNGAKSDAWRTPTVRRSVNPTWNHTICLGSKADSRGRHCHSARSLAAVP